MRSRCCNVVFTSVSFHVISLQKSVHVGFEYTMYRTRPIMEIHYGWLQLDENTSSKQCALCICSMWCKKPLTYSAKVLGTAPLQSYHLSCECQISALNVQPWAVKGEFTEKTCNSGRLRYERFAQVALVCSAETILCTKASKSLLLTESKSSWCNVATEMLVKVIIIAFLILVVIVKSFETGTYHAWAYPKSNAEWGEKIAPPVQMVSVLKMLLWVLNA